MGMVRNPVKILRHVLKAKCLCCGIIHQPARRSQNNCMSPQRGSNCFQQKEAFKDRMDRVHQMTALLIGLPESQVCLGISRISNL